MTTGRLAGVKVDRSLPFVDAHHHLWELDRLRYPWLEEPGVDSQTSFLGEYRAIRTDWGARRLFREFQGQNVSATVHVEAACLPEQAVDETAWLEAVAREYGLPNALVVFADLSRADAPMVLERHMETSALTRGVRARPEALEAPLFRAHIRLLARLGLSFDLAASPGRLGLGRDVADAAPDTSIILGHAGFPQRRDAEYFEQWEREMREVARAPNVAVKISGLGMADHSWTIESIRPWVLTTIEVFGLERTMLGTNWPVDILYSTYRELVDAYRFLLADAGLSREEQAAILHGNAQRHYRIAPGG